MKLRKYRLHRLIKPTTQIFLLLLLVNFLNFFYLSNGTYAAVPHLINYQGKLTNSQGQPITGAVNVTFRIYDQESGGSPLWTETYTGLTIDKGIFNVMLGGVTALNLAFDKQYYLGIQVGSDTEMIPRQRLASSGYAVMSENTLSIPHGIIVMWSGTILTIPTGWALCDGTNGTPDLRAKFVRGAPNSSTNPGSTGGSATHNHGGNTSAAGGGVRSGDYDAQSSPSGHSHTITSDSNLPPYYEVAFIMKL